MKANLIQSQSWDDVQTFFADLVASNSFFTPMLKLVEQIASSVYATGLYPATSMHTLLIAQSPTFGPGEIVLRIELNMNQESFRFWYYEKSFGRAHEKEVAVEAAFQTLEDFLKRRKWFLLLPEMRAEQTKFERLGDGE
jgi:hypothetical protein